MPKVSVLLKTGFGVKLTEVDAGNGVYAVYATNEGGPTVTIVEGKVESIEHWISGECERYEPMDSLALEGGAIVVLFDDYILVWTEHVVIVSERQYYGDS